MNNEVVLVSKKGEGAMIGVVTPVGFIPFMKFSSLDELKEFAMGILGYAEHYSPAVPNVFLKAFDKEETSDG